jgi:SOS-response transcriptional repressor LexA
MTYDDRPEPAIRLEQARKARGFERASDAADYFGWNYDTYIQHERGVNGLSRAGAKYAKAYGVSVGWLLTGDGPGPGERAVFAPRIPVISWVSAGALASDGLVDEPLGSIYMAGLPDGDWIALRVDGDSMNRISPPDSIIIVNIAEKQLHPNACYVIADENGNATYKRFRTEPQRFEPVSTNDAHEPFFISDNDHIPRIIGRVRMSVLSL